MTYVPDSPEARERRWYAEARRQREESRLPLTLEEKVDLADALYGARIIEKFKGSDHDTGLSWEWGSTDIGCTAPRLAALLDMVSEAKWEEDAEYDAS